VTKKNYRDIVKPKMLYIYASEKDKIIESETDFYSYELGVGKIVGKGVECLNDSIRFNMLALELRDEYGDFIYSLNRTFLNSGLVFQGDLSLFFLTDLSNKRTENFETYAGICHITLLKEKLRDKDLGRIVIDGCSRAFVRGISSAFSGHQITDENTIEWKPFPRILSQLKFFGKVFLQVLFLKRLSFLNPIGKNVGACFLTRYPLHFNSDFIEEKYGELVWNKKGYYLISIIADGIHQSVNVANFKVFTRELFSRSDNVFLLDNYLSFMDIIRALYSAIFVDYREKKLLKRRYVFRKINISEFMRVEIHHSLLRIPRILLFQRAITKFFTQNTVKMFYYYLHEYSYGRFFTYLLKTRFPDVWKMGFQHGPASRRRLLYYLSKNEPDDGTSDFLNYLPMPDEVLAEDENSKKVYMEAGYRNVSVMNRIYRLGYLKDIKRSHIWKDTVLVACGLHDGLYIFEALKNEMVDKSHKTYIFKLHPRQSRSLLLKRIEDLNPANVKTGGEHISHYLDHVSEVIATYSSVGYEAYLLGIPVRVMNLPNKINESPLLDIATNSEGISVS